MGFGRGTAWKIPHGAPRDASVRSSRTLSQDTQFSSDDQWGLCTAEDCGGDQRPRARPVAATTSAISLPGAPNYRYYRVLTSIENRFPISKEKGHAQIFFSWYDAFRPKNKATQPNVHFEKAAVLFNLAAVLNQSGLNCDRTAPDGLQAACKLFQARLSSAEHSSCQAAARLVKAGQNCRHPATRAAWGHMDGICAQEAAGMFAFMREGEASKVDTPRPMDLSPEAITTMEKLMLAQVGGGPMNSHADAHGHSTTGRLRGGCSPQRATR